MADQAYLDIVAIQDDQITPLEDQIRALVAEQQVIKADAWVEKIQVPIVIKTDLGAVTITSISRNDQSVQIDGTSDFLKADFWPLFISNPPLNVDVQGIIDAQGALTTVVVDAVAVVAADATDEV